jgi:hypothetical protein
MSENTRDFNATKALEIIYFIIFLVDEQLNTYCIKCLITEHSERYIKENLSVRIIKYKLIICNISSAGQMNKSAVILFLNSRIYKLNTKYFLLARKYGSHIDFHNFRKVKVG